MGSKHDWQLPPGVSWEDFRQRRAWVQKKQENKWRGDQNRIMGGPKQTQMLWDLIFDLVESRETMPMPLFQGKMVSRDGAGFKRSGHIWRDCGKVYFKCVLCGGITNEIPSHPEPEGWSTIRYDKLTDEDRKMCPRPPSPGQL